MAAGRTLFRNPGGWVHANIPTDASYLPEIVDVVGSVVRLSRGEPPSDGSGRGAERVVEKVIRPTTAVDP